MAAKKDVYLAIREHILNHTKIKHVRLFNNQFEEMEREDTFPLPCVFIEFASLEWEQKSRGLQEGEAIIRFHVGLESVRTEELEMLDLIDQLHSVLQDFSTDISTAMSRETETQDTDHDNVMIWIADYSTRITDESGLRRNKLISTNIETLDIEVCETSEFTKPRLKAKYP